MIGELTNHLWQSTIFAVGAGLLAAAFRRNRAHVRYWLWLSASLKFLIPLSALISLGNSLRDALAAGKIATQIAPPALSHTMLQITQPFPDRLMLVPSAPHTTTWIPIVIAGLWACGFAAVVLIRFRSWLRIRAVVRASASIGIPASVPIRSSRGPLEPGIVGLWRPILILPEGILHTLTSSQLEAVLAHELSHVRRRDNLTAAIHMIVEAVFWFYPLVWWIGARLVDERERACDEAVLSLGSEPRDYADAILSVCKLYVESPLLCAPGMRGSDLRSRIVRIMAQEVSATLTSGRKILLVGAAVAAIAIPVALGVIGASQAHAQKAQAGEVPLPKFETESIKVSTIPHPQLGQTYYGNGFVATNTAYELVCLAYGRVHSQLKPDQVSGGPDWIKSEVFDIEAKVEDSLVKGDWKKLSYDEREAQVLLMLRSLLADRFRLNVRQETKELPVYVLALADGGPKFGEDNSQSKSGRIEAHAPRTLAAISADFSSFAGLVSGWVGDRVLLDKTGLQSHYSFTFQWQPAYPAALGNQFAGSADRLAAVNRWLASSANFSALSEALENQLGLKLEAAKAPVATIVIEEIEHPTQN
jgi:uncharacterized protein (TIGR03435 family)